MGISTFDEATRPGGTGYVVTFYKLDCPKCGTVTVGEAVIGDPNWNSDGTVTCGKPEGEICDYRAEPETRKVDLAA